jgi:hypothetical protein
MLTLVRFLRYARAFEQTLRDDDWERVRPFFREDAVYDVDDPDYGCHLVGVDAVLAGIKKSLDGFDRKFPRRSVKLTRLPRLGWNRIAISWSVRYKHDSWTPYTLVGASSVRYRRGRIAHITDTFSGDARRDLERWSETNGVELDPSYA